MTTHAVPLNLAVPHRLHVVGVGGPGMSAIAQVLAEMGHTVTGSDLRDQPVLDRLRAVGVDIRIGHDPAVVHGADAVTASTAIPARNVELVEAAAIGVPVLRRAGMLASICAEAQSLGVAGTHGKTTTTSMLMLILAEAGLRPSFVIGGDVADLGSGAQWTGGQWLVVEADESDRTHLELPLYGTILTNIELDFLEHYGSAQALIDGFAQYLGNIDGPRVLCADDPLCRDLASRFPSITYGVSADADVVASDIVAEHGAMRFRVTGFGREWGEVHLPQRGEHNVANATGALAMAEAIGVPVDVAVRALGKFGGVARRFEIRGSVGGATLVDDYAHLPTEIDAVLRAARGGGDWQRVVAVFQPNRYNRMAEMWQDYAWCFTAADRVVLTEIYPSGTEPIPGISGRLVVDAVQAAHPDAEVVWLPRRDDLIRYVADEVRPGDVWVSMGCGDIAALPDEVVQHHERGHEVGR